MGHSCGQRHDTRKLFKLSKKRKISSKFSTNFRNFKVGERAEIKINSSSRKGLPYKWYQGKTGRIASIGKDSIIIEVVKKIKNKKILKRLCLDKIQITLSKSKESKNIGKKLKKFYNEKFKQDSITIYNFKTN